MAGCDHMEQIAQLHDKSVFTQTCLHHQIAVVPATTVYHAEELPPPMKVGRRKVKYVKPVTGVFASGFGIWIQRRHHLICLPIVRILGTSTKTFIESYRQSPIRLPIW